MVIFGLEADIIRRICCDFASGKAITAIVRELNDERVPGRRRTSLGWTPSTISRIPRNEKYVGRWTWNRTETRCDPRTGRKRRVTKPRDEWHVVQGERLRIVAQDVWERVCARWQEIDGTWPVSRKGRGREKQQRSYVVTHPPHLLSGMLRCAVCGAAMGQVSGSGKAGGYYGCLGGTKRACANRLLVPRTRLERRLVAALRERIAEPRALAAILERVERSVELLTAHIPQQIKEKRIALAAEERRVANFVAFIADGKATGAVATALSDAERRVDCLRTELELLSSTTAMMLQAPPLEWVARRVRVLDELLAKDVTRSALVIRDVLGTIIMRPIVPEMGRPYYQAETVIQVLSLLQDPDDGSNSLRKWRRRESNPRPKVTPRTRLRAYPMICRRHLRSHRQDLRRPAGGVISAPDPSARRGPSPNCVAHSRLTGAGRVNVVT